MLKVSFIIPCYNCEKYIARCLDSLYSQDIPENEYEVICVNDCSPDNMRDIIVEYQKNHNNLQLIDHEINKRQGGARNTGLKNAKGKYVWFIDNDDYIKENCIGRMLSVCIENDLDLLQFSYSTSGKVPLFFEQNETITGLSYYKKWLNTGESYNYSYMFCIWTRLLKREFLINNNIYFREHQPVLEDVAHSYKTFFYANKVQAFELVNYFFGENPVSSSRTNLNAEKLFNGRLGIIDDLLNLYGEIKSKDIYVAENLLRWNIIYHLSQIKYNFSRQSFGEQWKFIKMLKQHQNFLNSIVNRIGSDIPSIDKLILEYPFLLFILGYAYHGLSILKKKIH